MKYTFIASVCLAVMHISCTASQVPSPGNEGPVTLNVPSQLALEVEPVLNSHVGEEQWSRLQPMYGTYINLAHDWLLGDVPQDQNFANYPRIKKMSDGRYIMFYHGGQLGSRIWFTTSSDLKTWTTPVRLYAPVRVTIEGESDWRRFVNMDAVVLKSGEILAVCSFRATNHYSAGLGCGLMLIRSSDNGANWSEPQQIYDGPNWEPYLLELPDGRIQCYFTDPVPKARNSGTSMIVSGDGGKTWSSKLRVCRQYKYEYDGPNTEYTGQKIFTDQMPCFRVLNDGKTIAGILEGRLESPASISGTSYYTLSMVWNDSLDWKDLGEDGEGPDRRESNFMTGAAGYMATFPSGEVAVSCNVNSVYRLKIFNHKAENPSGADWSDGWLIPYSEKGYWGSVEADSPVTLIGAIHNGSGMQIGRFWLNHRIDASPAAVSLDGNAKEWQKPDALYLGSKSGVETLFRAARDANNLYILAETVCPEGEDPHALILKFSDTSASAAVSVTVKSSGEVTAAGADVGWSSSQGITGDGRQGVLTEFSVPLSALKAGEGDYVCFYAEAGLEATAFTDADKDNPQTWQRIRIAAE